MDRVKAPDSSSFQVKATYRGVTGGAGGAGDTWGASGAAVVGNSNITWQATGTRLGAIN